MLKFRKLKLSIVLSWAAVLLWLVLIFILSSQPATQSNSLSKKVTEIIVDKVGKLIPLDVESSTKVNWTLSLNHIIRKFAHFSMYFVLGVLMMNAFRETGIMGFKAIKFTLVFCTLYAISDELHQLFVPGRGGQLKDVLIDGAGSAFGVMVYYIGLRLGYRIKKIIKL